MKKFQILALLLIITLLFSSCWFKKKTDVKEVTPTSSPTASQTPSSSDPNVSAEGTPKSTSKNTPKNNTPTATNEPTKSGTTNKSSGAFMGMYDSTTLSIMEQVDGTIAEQKLKINPNLNFENSDIEIGEVVEYEYTISNDGVKTIEKIYRKTN